MCMYVVVLPHLIFFLVHFYRFLLIPSTRFVCLFRKKKLRYDRTHISKTEKDPTKCEKKINAVTERMKADMKYLDERLKKVEDGLQKRSQQDDPPIYAFVTFETIQDRDAVLRAYRFVSLWDMCCRNKKYESLKYQGQLLKCWEAPEPSTIIWENLGYSHTHRNRRFAFTTCISLLLIFISIVMIFASKYVQTRTGGASGGTSLCPEDFYDWDDATQKAYVIDNKDDKVLHCYCDQFSTTEQAARSFCRNYLQDNVKAQVLTYFASFVVLSINVIIEYIIKALSHWEKHHTEDARGKSLFIRLFILRYINNAAVFLINNNGAILRAIGLSDYESSQEFSADWFNTVGTTILLVQIGDVFFTHGNRFYSWWKFNRTLKQAHKDPSLMLTQDALNKAHVGPQLDFHANYAQLLSCLFVCLTFSTGMPILYFICAVNMFLFYYVEKYCFFNLYAIPPRYSAQMGKRASSLLPFALILHYAISVWVLSNPELFDNVVNEGARENASVTQLNSNTQDKISGQYTYPLFTFMLLLIAERILVYILKEFLGGVDSVND